MTDETNQPTEGQETQAEDTGVHATGEIEGGEAVTNPESAEPAAGEGDGGNPSPVAALELPPHGEDPPTQLEQRQFELAVWKLLYSINPKDNWLALKIDQIEREIATQYDPETGEWIGNKPIVLPLLENISPPEAQVASGSFVQQGLELSNKRYMGAHRLIAYDGLQHACWNDPRGMVNKFGGSERLYQIMGHILSLEPWFLLPTHELLGQSRVGKPYTPIKPETPYNDEEKRLWQENFMAFQMGTVGGGGLLGPRPGAATKFNSEVALFNPTAKVGERIQIPGVRIITIQNSPHAVISDIAEWVNTGILADRIYRTARKLAYDIDAGGGKVPGYRSPQEMGGSYSREWYIEVGERETRGKERNPNWPRFF